jgi:hypothetical protein
MRSPILRKAWRMPIIVVLGATLGIAGFLSVEAVLASGATEASASAPTSVVSPRERVSRRERRERLAEIRAGAFRNCSEARAAGAAPVYYGDPGYGDHLDGDSDGIGCEPHRQR